jgi:flavin-binding protein dodecin
MSEHVYKLIELVGSSTTGTDDAISNAIETAALTVRHIDWFEVVETRGHVVDGRVGHYQVTLKVGFRLAPETPAGDESSTPSGGTSGIGTA